MNLVVVPQVKEFIHGNMYYRETTVPKGTFVVGCTHKKDSIAFLLKGSIKQIDGDKEYIISAPSVITTTSGSQRFAFALEETTYSTVTHTNSVDINNIENEMYNEQTINSFVKEEYHNMLSEYGIEDNDIIEDMKNIDIIELDSKLFYKDNSGISGIGLFTNEYINENTLIGYALQDGIKTTIGRYINHCIYPNVYFNFNEKNVGVYTLYNLEKGTELVSDYRIPLNNLLGGNK